MLTSALTLLPLLAAPAHAISGKSYPTWDWYVSLPQPVFDRAPADNCVPHSCKPGCGHSGNGGSYNRTTMMCVPLEAP